MKMKKVLLSIVLALTVSLNGGQIVNATSNHEYTSTNTAEVTKDSLLTEQTIARMALDFANSMNPNLKLKVSGLIPVKNNENQITG